MSCGEFMAGPWECQLKEEVETFITKLELEDKFAAAWGRDWGQVCF
jgi:hypothetical protein